MKNCAIEKLFLQISNIDFDIENNYVLSTLAILISLNSISANDTRLNRIFKYECPDKAITLVKLDSLNFSYLHPVIIFLRITRLTIRQLGGRRYFHKFNIVLN